MKVIKLQAENVKRLRAVEIIPDPEGNVVVVSGRNGQGKTSVLDAIWFALGGGPATKDTSQPIREGEQRAVVTLDLGDFSIKRVWEGDTSKLTVMSKDGAKYSSPQKFLDEKLGALSFDPLAFAGMSAKEQRRLLLEVVATDVDVDELDRRRAAIFDQRTDVNRRLRDTEGALMELPEIPEDTPAEELSAAEVIAARETFLAEQRLRVERDGRVQALEDELEDLRHRVLTREATLAALKDERAAQSELVDVDSAAQIAAIESINALVRVRHQAVNLAADVAGYRQRAEELTATIAQLDATKQEALESADLPIEGLAFDEEGVLYGGIPFKQCSGAEQLRVSLAMAMALNPTIRVIRVADGSLLDSENMAVIAEMASAQDFQVWIERVDESGHVGFTIEDGEVSA